MLSDYQTRVIEGAIATLRQNLPALRDSLDNLATTLREGRAQPQEASRAWLQLEETLNHIDLLDRARKNFAQAAGAVFADAGGEGPDVIRAVRSIDLRMLLEALHAIAGTPVEGYIAQDGV